MLLGHDATRKEKEVYLFFCCSRCGALLVVCPGGPYAPFLSVLCIVLSYFLYNSAAAAARRPSCLITSEEWKHTWFMPVCVFFNQFMNE